MNKVYVIGIGYRALDRKAKDIISGSGVILANDRLLDVFKNYEEYEAVKERIKLINNVHETMNFISAEVQKCRSAEVQGSRTSELTSFSPIVLLADGDPLFFGIGRMIVKEFGKEVVEILPDLSSVQVAFSRIKEPWGDAFLISLHGGPDPGKRRKLEYKIEDIPRLLEKYGKIAILTDRTNNPGKVAKALDSSPVTRRSLLTMHVCERLGYPDEKITKGKPCDIAERSFSHPNVVIIQKRERQEDDK